MAQKLGKTAITCKDTPGFVVNRLLVPYLLDAARILSEGVASAEDIDTAMKLGCGMPMGPFELMDFTGVDIAYSVGEIFHGYTKEARFSPPGLMRNMVKAGYLGRKAGKGFYDHTGK
jgi:3-hydroxybutyryl-CoA dehydrogenase